MYASNFIFPENIVIAPTPLEEEHYFVIMDAPHISHVEKKSHVRSYQ